MMPRLSRNRTAAWLALLLVSGLLLAAFATPAAAQGETVKIMVLGETHGTRSVTKSLVSVAQSKGATGCVCPGDFTYGHWESSPGAWRDMMRPFMGNMMPAQGNHDWPWNDWSGMFPNGAHYYEKDVNGVQIIALNTEYSLAPGSAQRTWLEARLAESGPGALKVVQMHRPWWLPSGARHDTAEFEQKNGASASSMYALMEKHGVDLVVSAHEKNYQHSIRNGVHYLVAGGGGHEFYGMGYSLPGAVKRLTSNVVSTLDLTPAGMTLKSYDRYGGKIEEFTMGASTSGGGSTPAPAPTPTPAPSTGAADVTFRPETGNEWWVQARLGGADASRVTKVEARDANTAWTTLTLRSWGAYAGSFRVEPGNAVTYRATLGDGRTVESCPYMHPGGACAGPAPTTPSATPTQPAPVESGSFATAFRNPRGNDWWLEVEASASGGTLAGVDARVNGGAWTATSKQSWGSWAKSVHAPTGSTVEFRARSTDGQTATSGAYTWPPA